MKNDRGLVLAAAGLLCLVGADARASRGAEFGAGQKVAEFLSLARAGAAPPAPFARSTPETEVPAPAVEWVPVAAGKINMGRDYGYGNESPFLEVAVQAFEMSKALVTVEQYAGCVRLRRCSAPRAGGPCSWGKPGRQNVPLTCVSWDQAKQYAKFAASRPGGEGARLLSQSEWQYAAGGAGRGAEISYDREDGVSEWVEDSYPGQSPGENQYVQAPVDGSAREDAGEPGFRLFRGGSHRIDDQYEFGNHEIGYANLGFRLARAARLP